MKSVQCILISGVFGTEPVGLCSIISNTVCSKCRLGFAARLTFLEILTPVRDAWINEPMAAIQRDFYPRTLNRF